MDWASHEAVVREVADHARAGRVSRRIRLIFVWAVWAAATTSLLLFIHHYARNVPFADDWILIPLMTRHEPISLQWAWAQHNEHRVLVSKLILASLLRWVAPDFRAGMYLNAGLMSAAAASMIVLAHRLRGHQRLTDAVLPLSILSIGQYESLLIAFALNLVLTAWVMFGLISVLGRITERPPWMTVIPIGSALVILPLCGGSGLAMLPPLALWLAGYLCWGLWSGRGPGGWARAFGLASLMACSAIVALYLSNYIRMRPPAPSLRAIGRTTLEYLSLTLCSTPASYWKAAGVIVVVMVVAALVRLTVVAVRLPHERPRATGLAAVISSMLLVAIAVGIASSGYGPDGGLGSRYVSLASPLLCALFITWLIYVPAQRRWALQACLFVLICLSVPGSFQAAKNGAEPRLQCYKRVERGLKAGLPDSQILDVACPTIMPLRDWASVWLKMLRSSGIGYYKYPPVPQMAVLPEPGAVRR